MKKEKIGWAAAVCLLLLLFGVTVYMLRAFQRMTGTVSQEESMETEYYDA